MGFTEPHSLDPSQYGGGDIGTFLAFCVLAGLFVTIIEMWRTSR